MRKKLHSDVERVKRGAHRERAGLSPVQRGEVERKRVVVVVVPLLGARERSGFELLVVKREEGKESELESEQSEEGERRELASNDHLLFLNKFSYLLEMSRDRESTPLVTFVSYLIANQGCFA